ncbi:MAG: hypothetical protein KAI29_03360 [Cyclobacteriaceae bacterium]|nr:hypothetical protein [Cyclobacteriaceae bacterium]
MGYGISSDTSVQNADFNIVHGLFEENGFVSALKTEIQMVNQKADEIIQMVMVDSQ